MRSSAACRSRCSTSSGRNLDLSGSATGRVDYAWKSNRSGRLDLKVRGLSRAGLVLASKPIDVGIAAIVNGNQAALRAVAASDGAIVGRAQARFAPLGSGPLVAELMNAPLFAQLRYSGPADTLWRLTGSEVIDMSGPARGRRRHRRPARRSGRSAARSRPRTRGSKARSPAWSSTMSRRQARFSGPQLIFSQISRPDDRRRQRISGNGSVTFSGGKTLLNLSFNAEPGAAAQPRRRRRAGHRPAAAQVRRQRRRRSRATSSSTRAASSSAGRAPPRRCRSSTCARPASTTKT